MSNVLAVVSSITQRPVNKLGFVIGAFLEGLRRFVFAVLCFLAMNRDWWVQRRGGRGGRGGRRSQRIRAMAAQQDNDDQQEQRPVAIVPAQGAEGLPLMRLNNLNEIQGDYADLLEVRLYEQIQIVRQIIERHGFPQLVNSMEPFIVDNDNALQRLLRRRLQHAQRAMQRMPGHNNQEGNDHDDDNDHNDDGEDDGNSSDAMDDVSWLVNESEDEVCGNLLSDLNHQATIPTLKNLYRCLQQCKRKRLKKLYAFQPFKLIKCPFKFWCELGDFPTARSGHRVVATESHLYSLGGYNPHRAPIRNVSSKIYQELWSYNFATMRWELLLHPKNCTMPLELASAALIKYNNVLIVSPPSPPSFM